MDTSDLTSISLQYPDGAAIRDAYRELPKRGRLLLSSRTDQVAATLAHLEDSGFVAAQMNLADLSTRSCDIRAFKGKHGPCYETGRSARYLGAALAALDDDNHLLYGEMRICEKTATIYSLPAYENSIAVSDADPDLLQKLDRDPVDFNCDTLETDAIELRRRCTDPDPAETECATVLYPGPFRMLICQDGSMLRRGEQTHLPVHLVDALIKKDGCTRMPDDATRAPLFQQRFDELGTACLLQPGAPTDTFSAAVAMDLTALATAPASIIERLSHLIDRNDKQFVLVGSDPRDQFGCCPNDDVGAANSLVEAGILMLWRAPTPPDACPIGIYAFAGELHNVDGRAQGKPDSALRARIKAALQQQEQKDSQHLQRVLRWALILFILVSLSVTLVRKLYERSPATVTDFLTEVIQAEEHHQYAVLVLKYAGKDLITCPRCEHMEKAVAAELANSFQSAAVLAKTIDTQQEAYTRLADDFTLFTSTIYFIKLDAGKPVAQALFPASRAEQFHDGLEPFQQQLHQALQAFMKEHPHE